MTAAELLLSLRARDVRLSIDHDGLKCSAPVGALSAQMRLVLASRKDEILAFLRHSEGLGGGPRAIVPLKPEGARPPLFAVPGHNGDVFCYVALARYLDADQPLYGVQPPGLDGGEPLRSLTALAAFEVAQIRECRPQGPYRIAGYCAGGSVAFEIARQLTLQGQEVGLLALLGSPFPATYRRLPQSGLWVRSLGRSARRHLGALTSGGLAGALEHVRAEVRRRQEQALQDAGTAAELLARTRRVEAATIAAIRAYRPRPYRGDIDLFLPSEAWRGAGSGVERWRSLAHTVREHTGPDGSRLDVMLREPHVAMTAARLNERLAAGA